MLNFSQRLLGTNLDIGGQYSVLGSEEHVKIVLVKKNSSSGNSAEVYLDGRPSTAEVQT